jgi:uncharacterized membrane protein
LIHLKKGYQYHFLGDKEGAIRKAFAYREAIYLCKSEKNTMSASPKSYNHIAGQKIQRIEAISDGVFAIALTLLVLDIRVPVATAIHSEGELIYVFYSLLPKLLGYFLSFMTLGIFWTGHSTQYAYIEKSDRHLNWISLFFLLFVSILPFTTAFLSEYIHFKFSIALYWLNIFLLGLLLYIHWDYAYRHDFLTGTEEEKSTINQAIRGRIVIAQTLYFCGALLCFIHTYVSIGVIILIQLNYALGIFSKRPNWSTAVKQPEEENNIEETENP